MLVEDRVACLLKLREFSQHIVDLQNRGQVSHEGLIRIESPLRTSERDRKMHVYKAAEYAACLIPHTINLTATVDQVHVARTIR